MRPCPFLSATWRFSLGQTRASVAQIMYINWRLSQPFGISKQFTLPLLLSKQPNEIFSLSFSLTVNTRKAERQQKIKDLIQRVWEGDDCWQSAGFWVLWGVWSVFWLSLGTV